MWMICILLTAIIWICLLLSDHWIGCFKTRSQTFLFLTLHKQENVKCYSIPTPLKHHWFQCVTRGWILFTHNLLVLTTHPCILCIIIYSLSLSYPVIFSVLAKDSVLFSLLWHCCLPLSLLLSIREEAPPPPHRDSLPLLSPGYWCRTKAWHYAKYFMTPPTFFSFFNIIHSLSPLKSSHHISCYMVVPLTRRNINNWMWPWCRRGIIPHNFNSQ